MARDKAAIAALEGQIEAIIGEHPEGIGLRAILEEHFQQRGEMLAERTLSRRIQSLVEAGRVISRGRARLTRYFPSTVIDAGFAPGRAARSAGAGSEISPAEEDHVGLSTAGAAARDLVRRPMAARTPVGYDERFLRRYKPGRTWYLSEAIRRRLHDLGRYPHPDRPAGTFVRGVFERLLIDLAWSSSRLEGNTYSRLDTRNLLEHGIRAEGKQAAEAQMILNHKKAIELLVDGAEWTGFDRHTFFNLHAALAENLLDDPRDEGRIRSRVVQVSGTTYVPLSIPQKLDELLDVLLAKAEAIPDPFEQAFFVMVQLPYLQPFADVNKRTSRLAANISLIKTNVCPLSFVDVPERLYLESTLAIYERAGIELLRDVFVWAYERSCTRYRVVRESLGEPDPVRLKYRPLLGEVIREAVQELREPRLATLLQWADQHGVPEADRNAFADRALELLVALHDGSIARYDVLPRDFQRWKAAVTGR